MIPLLQTLLARSFVTNSLNIQTATTLEQAEGGEDLHAAKDAEDLFRQLGI